jgi:hypothetical protein
MRAGLEISGTSYDGTMCTSHRTQGNARTRWIVWFCAPRFMQQQKSEQIKTRAVERAMAFLGKSDV